MNMLGSEPFLPQSITSLAEDVLIKKLLLSHDPDGRHLDSELLLCAVENIMICTTAEEVIAPLIHICRHLEQDYLFFFFQFLRTILSLLINILLVFKFQLKYYK